MWLEAAEKNRPRYIFLDVDETLVHHVEDGWLKECPGNKHYAPLLIHGQHPYPMIKTIRANGETSNLFPRPRLEEFVRACADIASVHVLSHNSQEYLSKVVSAYGLGKWVKTVNSTRKLEPGSLGRKFDLDNALWVLVDNMPLGTIEMVQKLRVLGLGFPHAKNPNEEGRRIVRDGREHFVNIENWYPTVDEHADNGLFKVLPEIRRKLGLE